MDTVRSTRRRGHPGTRGSIAAETPETSDADFLSDLMSTEKSITLTEETNYLNPDFVLPVIGIFLCFSMLIKLVINLGLGRKISEQHEDVCFMMIAAIACLMFVFLILAGYSWSDEDYENIMEIEDKVKDEERQLDQDLEPEEESEELEEQTETKLQNPLFWKKFFLRSSRKVDPHKVPEYTRVDLSEISEHTEASTSKGIDVSTSKGIDVSTSKGVDVSTSRGLVDSPPMTPRDVEDIPLDYPSYVQTETSLSTRESERQKVPGQKSEVLVKPSGYCQTCLQPLPIVTSPNVVIQRKSSVLHSDAASTKVASVPVNITKVDVHDPPAT